MKILLVLAAVFVCALAYTVEIQPEQTQEVEHHGRQKRYVDPILGGLLLGKAFLLGSIYGPQLLFRRHGHYYRVPIHAAHSHHAPVVTYAQSGGWGWN